MEEKTNQGISGLTEKICKILDDKKAMNIQVIDVGHLTIVAEQFVIASARSTLQVRTLCDELEERLEAEGVAAIRKDGHQGGRWVVLDYGHVIVHIFHEQEREYYNLERLWMDGSNQHGYPEDAQP
ncbi:MAG: ribosome silencing factor [Christensenellales bacterium]|jgi:ribosome-associated protein